MGNYFNELTNDKFSKNTLQLQMTRVMMIQIVLDLHAQITQQGRATLTPIIATTGVPTVTAMLIMLVMLIMLITVMVTVTVTNFKTSLLPGFFVQFFFFQKIITGIPTSLVKIRPDVLSGLIWIQSVCKGYKQTTLVSNKVKSVK